MSDHKHRKKAFDKRKPGILGALFLIFLLAGVLGVPISMGVASGFEDYGLGFAIFFAGWGLMMTIIVTGCMVANAIHRNSPANIPHNEVATPNE